MICKLALRLTVILLSWGPLIPARSLPQAWGMDLATLTLSPTESTFPIQQAQIRAPDTPPSLEPLPEPGPPPELPPPEDLLQPPPVSPLQPETPVEGELTFIIRQFKVEGSTVFTQEELEAVTAPYTGRPLSFAELLQVRSAITQLYIDAGYSTSGAIIPPQTITDGVVRIEVIEGRLEKIDVTGTRRLQADYIRSRLERAAGTPVNLNRLLEGLQLLQLDPLIQSISADLQAGVQPGSNRLVVSVVEADSFSAQVALDNNRVPSVGSSQRQLYLSEGNLTGWGDSLQVGYVNTDGSNSLDLRYRLPVNPQNGSLSFAVGTSWSNVIDPDFRVLDISGNSQFYELTYRQPIHQTASDEFALGLTLTHQASQSFLGFADIGGFPLSPGADANGIQRITALRFSQEWTHRDTASVLAARSQFSLGLGLLGATVNPAPPDSRFLAWRGQGQWVQRLGPDSLLLLRTDMQLADTNLLSLEQFRLGGQYSVRGYQQDLLLTDNGLQGSAEVRLPILRVPEVGGLLQVTPFLDAGTGWNNGGPNPSPQTLVGTGVGLLWQQGGNFTARLDWGIPLVTVAGNQDTLQENGIYFSLGYTFF